MNNTQVLAGVILTVASVGLAFYNYFPRTSHHAHWMVVPPFQFVASIGSLVSSVYGIVLILKNYDFGEFAMVWLITGFISAGVVRAASDYFPGVFAVSVVLMLLGLVVALSA